MLPTTFQFIWPNGFRGKYIFNRPIRINNCLWWPCLLTDQDEMCYLYRGHSIDTTYQVSVHLVKVILEEKIKMWKVNGRESTDAKWWQKLTLSLARWANNWLALIQDNMSEWGDMSNRGVACASTSLRQKKNEKKQEAR